MNAESVDFVPVQFVSKLTMILGGWISWNFWASFFSVYSVWKQMSRNEVLLHMEVIDSALELWDAAREE
jgi:hypothetical protein